MAVTNNGNCLKFGTTADAVTGNYYVKGFAYYSGTTAGHKVVFTDTAGNIIWGGSVTGNGGYASISFAKPIHVNGLIATFDSGVPIAYIE